MFNEGSETGLAEVMRLSFRCGFRTDGLVITDGATGFGDDVPFNPAFSELYIQPGIIIIISKYYRITYLAYGLIYPHGFVSVGWLGSCQCEVRVKIIIQVLMIFPCTLSSIERIRMQYAGRSTFLPLQILNNTVVNTFTRPLLKREVGGPGPSDSPNGGFFESFEADCNAVQGHELPIWTTDSTVTGNASGIVVNDGDQPYGSLIASEYTATLFFFIVIPSFNGSYRCLSRSTGLFSQFFLTTGRCNLGCIHDHMQIQISMHVYIICYCTLIVPQCSISYTATHPTSRDIGWLDKQALLRSWVVCTIYSSDG